MRTALAIVALSLTTLAAQTSDEVKRIADSTIKKTAKWILATETQRHRVNLFEMQRTHPRG